MGLDSIVDTLMAPEEEQRAVTVEADPQTRNPGLSPSASPQDFAKRGWPGPESQAGYTTPSKSTAHQSVQGSPLQEGEIYLW